MTYLFEVHFLDSIGDLKVKEVESEPVPERTGKVKGREE